MQLIDSINLNEKAETIADQVFFMISNMEYHSSKNDIPEFLDHLKEELREDPLLYPMILTSLERIFQDKLNQLCDKAIKHS
ncbi:hypothetical protein [Virgibacillus salexigens]|uniref:Uncharacterized protein n=1 Tax=Virgibacillus massiliensis TaxID=1462526 RepID=A0A024QHD5_9BACI|nr:hypothetical protein [Virgibacillus massiliensis]CDQ41904.1 hypothetical protein BN990_04283 [Virgibacillus massiliensis]